MLKLSLELNSKFKKKTHRQKKSYKLDTKLMNLKCSKKGEY